LFRPKISALSKPVVVVVAVVGLVIGLLVGSIVGFGISLLVPVSETQRSNENLELAMEEISGQLEFLRGSLDDSQLEVDRLQEDLSDKSAELLNVESVLLDSNERLRIEENEHMARAR